MNQVAQKDTSKKAPANLDALPEDVQFVTSTFIEGWAERGQEKRSNKEGRK